MTTRRLSLILSLLALGLMVLACSMSWQGSEPDDSHMALPLDDQGARATATRAEDRCQDLDSQLVSCSESLDRAWRPITPPHYPDKVRRLIEIKRRYELADEASRACRDAFGTSVSGSALRACLAHPSCDHFATCVADSMDNF